MTRLLAICAATLALGLLAPLAHAAGGGRITMTCDHQSFAGFPGAFTDSGNLVVGPLAWIGAAGEHPDGRYGAGYRWKFPLLVRPGHRVTVRIGAAAASFARLAFRHDAGWRFDRAQRTVVFRACAAAKAGSRSDGRRVTFWSGGLVASQASGCVPIEIRIDRRAVRHRTIAIGDATCA